MIRNYVVEEARRRLLAALALVMSCACPAFAQNGAYVFSQNGAAYDPAQIRRPDVPDLSEATAIFESAIRSLYVTIEPGSNVTSPNELLAYSDLRCLRLYAGALEVAGWNLDKCSDDYRHFDGAGAYHGGRGRVPDADAQIALERFRAARETVRSLLQRVRTTAVLAEHQISFCDPQVGRQWRQDVLPALRDTVAATDPIFEPEIVYQRYGVPGQQPAVIQASATGIPGDACDIGRYPTYRPYDGQGRGQGKYFQIRSFGGDVRVKSIRCKNHENAFGLVGTSAICDIPVNQVVAPGEPFYVPCNRGRWVDISDLEIEWEPVQRGRKVYGMIELVENCPTTRN